MPSNFAEKYAPASFEKLDGLNEDAHQQLLAFLNCAGDTTAQPLLRNVLLLGCRGGGKTLIANLLARRLCGNEISLTPVSTVKVVSEMRDKIRATIAFNKIAGQAIAFVDDVDSMPIEFQRALIRSFDEPDEVIWIATATDLKNVDPAFAYRFAWVDISPAAFLLKHLASEICRAEKASLPEFEIAAIVESAAGSYTQFFKEFQPALERAAITRK